MAFTHIELTNIPHALSEPRFSTYLRASNRDREQALKLYQWNLEVSAAFIVPLHLLEICVRNAVVDALVAVHTAKWPWNAGFRRRLPNPKKGFSSQRELGNVAARQPTAGKVIAELKFVFWEKMFTGRHDTQIWNNHIGNSFPGYTGTMNQSQLRGQIYNDISVIRQLRNRIAHHEPIFSRNLQDEYNSILKLISWRDNTTADWVSQIQGVTQIMANRP